MQGLEPRPYSGRQIHPRAGQRNRSHFPKTHQGLAGSVAYVARDEAELIFVQSEPVGGNAQSLVPHQGGGAGHRHAAGHGGAARERAATMLNE